MDVFFYKFVSVVLLVISFWNTLEYELGDMTNNAVAVCYHAAIELDNLSPFFGL